MVTAAIFTTIVPLGAALSALIAWWVIAAPRIAIVVLAGALLAGQLVRLPLPGQGGGLLLADAAVLLVLLAAGFKLLMHVWIGKAENTERYGHSLLAARITLLTSPFLGWSLFTLAIHAPALGAAATVIALAYWVRLATYILLLPALLLLLRDRAALKTARQALAVTTVVLAVVGLLQLALFPNLAQFPQFIRGAWDPHEKRLLSTWLDPNFIGLFFSLSGIYGLFQKRFGVVGISLLALMLTQSRSAVFALLLSALLLSPLLLMYIMRASSNPKRRAVQVLAITGMLTACIGVGLFMFGSRLPAAFVNDPTVALRISALTQIWSSLGEKTALFGVGYNGYQFAALEEGLIDSFTMHSRAGADNSLLTLWITTGIPGVIFFLLPWVYLTLQAWSRIWQTWQLQFFSIPLSLLMVLAHAQVVNSLLYGHILITMALVFAIVFAGASKRKPVYE